MVADALSRKSRGMLAQMRVVQFELVEEISNLGLEILRKRKFEYMVAMVTRSAIVQKMKEAQVESHQLQALLIKMELRQILELNRDCEGVLRFIHRLWVPEKHLVKEELLSEAHISQFAIHLGGLKMYKDLKKAYQQCGMKRDVIGFVSHCLMCQQVKEKHLRPVEKLQNISILE